MRFYFFAPLLILVTIAVSDDFRFYHHSLNTAFWTVTTDSGPFRGKQVNATVPGDVYSDLKANGLIDDPYYYGNDDKYKAVALSNWTYTTTFSLPSNILMLPKIQMIFDGLDTFASLNLNGQPIGSSKNMFARYVFNVAEFIERQNTLLINFTSPVEHAAYQAQNYPYRVPPECPPDVQHGQCHVNFLRKEQASFSWDWGPAFPTVGIWKSAEVFAYSVVNIDRFSTEITYNDKDRSWTILARVFLNNPLFSGQSEIYNMVLQQTGLNVTGKFNVGSEVNITLTVSDKDVQRWWPNGYGAQALYNLTVSVGSSSSFISNQSKLIGFRTIELVQRPLTKGLSFYFTVNGKPIFMKGSNWIPADSFPTRVTRDKLKTLMSAAHDANMNMLRVWGGGIYEQDYFYELADMFGIMIWQDFMFACAMYPTNSEFLDNVEQEIIYQIHRLKHHPSIAVWAGNNENEAALRQNWYKTANNFSLYSKDFVQLYIKTIKPVIERENPSAIYVSSSPSNGLETEKEGWIAKNPYSTIYGDVHYYNYSAGRWYVDDHPKSRFLSEYGMQSWPSMRTLSPVSSKADWSEFSPFALNRNHHGQGQQQINAQVKYYFNPPNASSDPAQNFSDYIYLTQITQAMYIKGVSEFARRLQSYEFDDGGLTMGALYWQLNDIWQAPSWSSIEYGGRWKMLHYYAKTFFAPIAFSLAIEDGNLVSYIIQDLEKPSKPSPTFLSLECRNWNKFDPVSSMDYQIEDWDQSMVSQRVLTHDFNATVSYLHCDDDDPNYAQNRYIMVRWGPHYGHIPLTEYKNINMNKANITMTVGMPVQTSRGVVFPIDLKTTNPALFVWLETNNPGTFSDNGFLMYTETVSIHFLTEDRKLKPSDLEDIVISSLMDLYG